ncbi:hypothetical protein DM01DRAFT_1345971 [Hesseltinella vesiculosa]|uniref:Rho-GAP domain-containing protein n=1 Tax=Hesseltinella vesiculosa TaxID=101127 RepID=A0A1X2GHW3_9FUNG|nr:hypothetical protein DM01DRAFT_1345971 [Hesseltinella vesiculosa]
MDVGVKTSRLPKYKAVLRCCTPFLLLDPEENPSKTRLFFVTPRAERNNMLFLKVFYHQVVDAEDLRHYSVYTVATVLQDILWGCHDRIVSKKIWRRINYETCTLQQLEPWIAKDGFDLLVEIIDFLVLVMRHKKSNLMHACHLGEAMGKVVLGPADCDALLAEKASHFMTRLLIDQSKRLGAHQPLRSMSADHIQHEHVNALHRNRQATLAKAKSYDRLVLRQRRQGSDFFAMATNQAESAADVGLIRLFGYHDDPWLCVAEPELDDSVSSDSSCDDLVSPSSSFHHRIIHNCSIFDPSIDPALSVASPTLFRILTNAKEGNMALSHAARAPMSPASSSFSSSSTAVSSTSSDDLTSKMTAVKRQNNATVTKHHDVLDCLHHAFDDVQHWIQQHDETKRRWQARDNQRSLKSSFGKLYKAVKTHTPSMTITTLDRPPTPPPKDTPCYPRILEDSGFSQNTICSDGKVGMKNKPMTVWQRTRPSKRLDRAKMTNQRHTSNRLDYLRTLIPTRSGQSPSLDTSAL